MPDVFRSILWLGCSITLFVGESAADQVLSGKESSSEELEFSLSTGSWDRFLQEPPVLLVGDLKPEVESMLDEGEGILVNLFNVESLDIEELVADRFESEVKWLKTKTPDVVTKEGYSKKRKFYRYGSFYCPRQTIIIFPTYYGKTHSKRIKSSTTSGLIREVRFAVGNLDIKSISSRIGLLELTHRKWMDRTRKMVKASNLTREANFTYLKRLEDYIGAWRDMEESMERFRSELSRIKTDRGETLKSWEEYEKNQLEELHPYFESAQFAQIPLEDGKLFRMPGGEEGQDRILKANVSGRDLYFRLQDGIGSQLHPFRLVEAQEG
ncbi:MAG: hypothetical protein AAGJ81_13945 [Verrucomicrobiota bacterium]